MAINDITLTAGMRSTLTSLQETARLFDRTQTRLASGKKVNTALDDPINYFAAKGYMDRASDLSSLKDSMNESIQTIKAADAGISAIQSLISQGKSLVNAASATSDAALQATLQTQYTEVLDQIDALALDAGYNGTNLLDGDTLTVSFNTDGTSSLTITGSASDSGTLGIGGTVTGGLTELGTLDDALGTLRTSSQTLSSNLGVIQTRLDFTSAMVNTLTKGAENLTLADMNEEGANLLMLQTRQSLSSTSLSLASQAAQSVLRLF